MIDRRSSARAVGARWLAAAMIAFGAGTAQAQLPTAGAGPIRTAQQAMGETSVTPADLTMLPGQSPSAMAIQAQLAQQNSARGIQTTPTVAPGAQPASANQTAAQVSRMEKAGMLPPFGARLFLQPDVPASLPLSDGTHIVAPGDEVRVMIWGGYNFDAALKVQKDGSIFLPFAGVLKLAGLRESELPQVVQRKVATVFTGSVQSSASLLSANPVRIYVTGYAAAPGIYEGYPGEGAFAFLKRAGGVDPTRGSYSNIQVLRGGQSIAQVDLYDLVANGRQTSLSLQSGDTLHVGLRGPVVAVRGLVGVEAEFELGQKGRTLGQLADLAGADQTATQVRLERVRAGRRTVEIITLDNAAWRDQAMLPGDAVDFGRSDRTETIYVRIRGEHEGVSELVLPKGATLADALARVAPNAWSQLPKSFVVREDIRLAQILFKSTAARQIESTILGARSASIDEARLRKEEADLLLDWVKRLERYDVRGALVAASNEPRDIFLASGDIVEIPSTRAPVFVVGDVFTPTAAQQSSGFTTRDYLKLAGVNPERPELQFFIQQPNGVVRAGVTLDAKPEPGDQVFVLPQVDSKRLQGSKDLLQIIYQLAVSSKIIFGL